MDPSAIVYVVDDDQALRDSLAELIAPWGLRVETYPSAEAFLDRYTEPDGRPRCMVLDVRLPGLSGTGLRERLERDGIHMPVILISAYGEVSLAVEAVQAGAVDFLEKPFRWQRLLDRIQAAIQHSVRHLHNESRRAEIRSRRSRLTEREREVMELVADGKEAKAIGRTLGISEKTAMKHRARLFQKMEVTNAVELARLLSFLGDGEPDGAP